LDLLGSFHVGKFIAPEEFYVVGGASSIEQIAYRGIMKNLGSPMMQGLILSS
jgi:hypothetical protein